MKISVIIPTKNRRDDLQLTLKSIFRNTILPLEIIIVDQTCENQEKDIRECIDIINSSVSIKYFHAPLISGLVHARDFGYQRSIGDIVLFLDDDITVFSNFFEQLIYTYQRYPNIDAVCPIDVSEEKVSLLRIMARCVFWIGPFWTNKTYVNKFYKRFNKPVKTNYFSGGFMSCKRYVYESVGFDKNLSGHVFVDDWDFSYRATKIYNFIIDPNLRVIHREGKALYDIQEAIRKRVHSRIYFFKKNINKNLLNYVAFYWLMFGTFLGTLVRAMSNKSMKPIKGFLDGLKNV